MKWFLNLKIAAKLISSFIIVALIAGIVGVIGLININTINQADTMLYTNNTKGIEIVGNACIYYQRVRYNLLKMMLVDEEEANECITKIETYTVKVEEYLGGYKESINTDEANEEYLKLASQWDKFSGNCSNIIEAFQSGNLEEAKKIQFGEATETGDNLQTLFDEIVLYNATAAKNRSESNDQIAQQSVLVLTIIIAVGVVIAISLGTLISRIISKPVSKLVVAANQMALGDVNVNVSAETKDEIGILAQAFGLMVGNIRNQAIITEKIADGDLTVEVNVRSENDLLGRKLSEMVERNNEIMYNISVAAEQVSSGAKQISDSSIALSQGATEQASSVEQLTAALEEISSQTELNAKNANQANDLAVVAKNNAVEGNNQMKDMQTAMEEINDSSSNISKIIKVIDEIAFQTNILALNAAVEAARAGQQGKGFAVVAEEVRNLAARSANAAKETTELIEGSIKKVEAGTKLANVTASALNKIVEDVSRAAELVNNIAIASNEQASGIAQVNQGIIQVSQVIQTNSSTSEESAAASEELSSQAQVLNESVRRFKLKKLEYRGREYNTVSSDVIKMLDNRSVKSKRRDDSTESNEIKIALSDSEFGKY